MEIIIEFTLLINFLLNFFIVKITALFLKEKARFCTLSALLGAAISLIAPLCHLNVICKLIVTVFTAAFMVSLSFSFKKIKKFIMIYGSFLGGTFLFGGGCYAATQAFGQLPLIVLGLIAFGIYICAYFILKARNKKRVLDNFSFKVKLCINGQEVEEEGYLDSGNVLYDPITNKPIVLITYEVFSKFFHEDYLNAYMKKIDPRKFKCGHYVKINTVASGTSILVFNADKLEVLDGDKRTYNDISLGLSFSGFDKSLGKKILLHSELV